MSAPLLQRLARIAPYFRESRAGFAAALLATVVAASTEPVLPALLKRLLDEGFGATRSFPLWIVPVIIIGLYLVRGVAQFAAQYALAWSTNRGVLVLREGMFARLLDAAPALFSERSASSLTNTLVYEVQSGAQQLAGALTMVVRDLLTSVFLLGYLLWLNWKLTLFIVLLAPLVALVMRSVSSRLDKLTRAWQTATDELAYVVEENTMAWRIVRVHGAAESQRARFQAQSQRLRRLMIKTATAGAISSPITQMIAAVAVSAVVVMALWQGSSGEAATVGQTRRIGGCRRHSRDAARRVAPEIAQPQRCRQQRDQRSRLHRPHSGWPSQG